MVQVRRTRRISPFALDIAGNLQAVLDNVRPSRHDETGFTRAHGEIVRLDLSILLPHLGFLAQGALLTAEACVLALVGSVIMGAFVAIARTSSSAALRRIAFVYVDIFRNVPFIVQL